MLFIRNIKKGWATNSSSYHSTITGYIEIPEEIWIEFKEQDKAYKITNHNGSGYSKGIVLHDDEGRFIRSYDDIIDEIKDIEDLKEINGKKYVRVIIEYTEGDY